MNEPVCEKAIFADARFQGNNSARIAAAQSVAFRSAKERIFAEGQANDGQPFH